MRPSRRRVSVPCLPSFTPPAMSSLPQDPYPDPYHAASRHLAAIDVDWARLVAEVGHCRLQPKPAREPYEALVATIVGRMNARVSVRLAVERAMLRTLPARRTAEFEELPARVSKYGVFTVKGAQYSAPSQLIGHRLMVRLYTEPIECWLGGQRVLQRPRATVRSGPGPARAGWPACRSPPG